MRSEHTGVPRPRCSGGSSLNSTKITSSSAIPPPSAPSAAQASRCWGASPVGKGSSYRAGSRSMTARRSGSIGGSAANHGDKVVNVIVKGISTASTQPATWSQSSSVTTGTSRPRWLPCAKRMRATVSSDDRRGFPATLREADSMPREDGVKGSAIRVTMRGLQTEPVMRTAVVPEERAFASPPNLSARSLAYLLSVTSGGRSILAICLHGARPR
jgi:hypothetical protein